MAMLLGGPKAPAPDPEAIAAKEAEKARNIQETRQTLSSDSRRLMRMFGRRSMLSGSKSGGSTIASLGTGGGVFSGRM